MAKPVVDALLRLVVEGKQATAQLAEVNKNFQNMDTQIKRSGDALDKLGKKFEAFSSFANLRNALVLGGVTALVNSLSRVALTAASSAVSFERLKDKSEAYGVSVRDLIVVQEELKRRSFKSLGTSPLEEGGGSSSIDSFNRGIVKWVDQLSKGGERAKEIARQLGLSREYILSLSKGELFKEVLSRGRNLDERNRGILRLSRTDVANVDLDAAEKKVALSRQQYEDLYHFADRFQDDLLDFGFRFKKSLDRLLSILTSSGILKLQNGANYIDNILEIIQKAAVGIGGFSLAIAVSGAAIKKAFVGVAAEGKLETALAETASRLAPPIPSSGANLKGVLLAQELEKVKKFGASIVAFGVRIFSAVFKLGLLITAIQLADWVIGKLASSAEDSNLGLEKFDKVLREASTTIGEDFITSVKDLVTSLELQTQRANLGNKYVQENKKPYTGSLQQELDNFRTDPKNAEAFKEVFSPRKIFELSAEDAEKINKVFSSQGALAGKGYVEELIKSIQEKQKTYDQGREDALDTIVKGENAIIAQYEAVTSLNKAEESLKNSRKTGETYAERYAKALERVTEATNELKISSTLSGKQREFLLSYGEKYIPTLKEFREQLVVSNSAAKTLNEVIAKGGKEAKVASAALDKLAEATRNEAIEKRLSVLAASTLAAADKNFADEQEEATKRIGENLEARVRTYNNANKQLYEAVESGGEVGTELSRKAQSEIARGLSVVDAQFKRDAKESIRSFDLYISQLELQSKRATQFANDPFEAIDLEKRNALIDLEQRVKSSNFGANDEAEAEELKNRAIERGTKAIEAQYDIKLKTAALERELVINADKYSQVAIRGMRAQASGQEELIRSSRSFSDGWRTSFEDFEEAARGSADVGRIAFQSFTSGIDDALESLITGSEFRFKRFVGNILKDIAKAGLKKSIVGLFEGGLQAVFGGLLPTLFGGGGGVNFGGASSLPGFNTNAVTSSLAAGGYNPVGTSIINNTYSIQALDGNSVASILFQNRDAVYSAQQAASRSRPLTG